MRLVDRYKYTVLQEHFDVRDNPERWYVYSQTYLHSNKDPN